MQFAILDIEHTDLWTSDVKAHANKFVARNCCPDHQFESMSHNANCLTHPGRDCREELRAETSLPRDIYIAGFTCQPYATSRHTRFQGSYSWKTHKTHYTTEKSISNMNNGKFEWGLLENVGGTLKKTSDEDITPAEFISSKIEATGNYLFRTISQNHNVWTDMPRFR